MASTDRVDAVMSIRTPGEVLSVDPSASRSVPSCNVPFPASVSFEAWSMRTSVDARERPLSTTTCEPFRATAENAGMGSSFAWNRNECPAYRALAVVSIVTTVPSSPGL